MSFRNGPAGRLALRVLFKGLAIFLLDLVVAVNTYFRMVDIIRYFTSRHLTQPEAE